MCKVFKYFFIILNRFFLIFIFQRNYFSIFCIFFDKNCGTRFLFFSLHTLFFASIAFYRVKQNLTCTRHSLSLSRRPHPRKLEKRVREAKKFNVKLVKCRSFFYANIFSLFDAALFQCVQLNLTILFLMQMSLSRSRIDVRRDLFALYF